MSVFAIRAACHPDCESLMVLIADHARFENGHATIERERLRGLLKRKTSPVEVFVAIAGNDLAGYGALTLDFSLWRGTYWAHLDCLFVSEPYRGQGLGAQLLQHAMELAGRHSADRLEWQTPEWNSRAIAFYERQGAHSQPKVRFSLAS